MTTMALPPGQKLRIHVYLWLMMVIWGINISAVKVLTGHLDVMLVAAWRMVMASIALVAIMRWFAVPWPNWCLKSLALGLISALLMVYANQALFASGVARTSSTNAALIVALGPLFSGLLESFFLGRHHGRMYYLGVAVAFAGVAVVVLHNRHGEMHSALVGDVSTLCAVVSFAAGGMVLQHLARKTDPLAISAFVHVFGTAMLVVHAAATSSGQAQVVVSAGVRDWVLILFSGVIATALGAWIWGKGIATFGVGRTATYLSWVPIFGVAWAAVFLGEPLNVWHFVGLAAVVAGSVAANRSDLGVLRG